MIRDDSNEDDYGVDPDLIVRSMRKLQKRMVDKAGIDPLRYCFVVAKENGARLAAHLLRKKELCVGRTMLAEVLPDGCGEILGFLDMIPIVIRDDCPAEVTYLIEIATLHEFNERDDARE